MEEEEEEEEEVEDRRLCQARVLELELNEYGSWKHCSLTNPTPIAPLSLTSLAISILPTMK